MKRVLSVICPTILLTSCSSAPVQSLSEMVKGFNMPVFNTMGNHENYGYSSFLTIDPNHPECGEKMFEKRIGKRYYSFDHKGWHFMVLDGIEKGDGNWSEYFGKVDDTQIAWIREDLAKLNIENPIVLVTHISLVSIMPQIRNGPIYAENYSSRAAEKEYCLAPSHLARSMYG